MSENELMKSKEAIIGDLFSIRAGISYIDELVENRNIERGKKSAKLNSINKAKQTIEQIETKIDHQQPDIELKKAEVDKKKELLKSKEEMLEKTKNTPINKFRTENEKSFKKWCLVIDAVALINVGFAIGFVFEKSSVFLLIVTAFIGIAAIIGRIIYQIKEKPRMAKQLKADKIRQLTHDIYSEKKEAEVLQERLDKEIAEMPRKTEELNKKKNELLQVIPKYQSEADRLQISIDALKNEANAFYDALVEEYGAFFHPTNWVNLDRVVYYLSTGRAETLREALNLMDQRLNAEMIANELKATTNMITREIRESTIEMRSAISRCASAIGSAIYTATKAMVASNAALTSQLEYGNSIAVAQVNATERLVSAQQLGNALQAKSNKTMEQMLYDYRLVNDRVQY